MQVFANVAAAVVGIFEASFALVAKAFLLGDGVALDVGAGWLV